MVTNDMYEFMNISEIQKLNRLLNERMQMLINTLIDLEKMKKNELVLRKERIQVLVDVLNTLLREKRQN